MSNKNNLNCFRQFKNDISNYILPDSFTYPFYYTPHPISILAVSELQHFLTHNKTWAHNFGVNKSKIGHIAGKMFGVLIVKQNNNKLGYICAYSGQITEKGMPDFFVPNIFDDVLHQKDMTLEKSKINELTNEIDKLNTDKEYKYLEKELKEKKENLKDELDYHREEMRLKKKDRKELRISKKDILSGKDYELLLSDLVKQSLHMKYQQKVISEKNNKIISKIEVKLNKYLKKLESLKDERKNRSKNLHNKIYEKYKFMNIEKQEKDLVQIFLEYSGERPPSGAGDCAAPKLLQYAFSNNLTPIAMAEFWWGAPHKSAIRKHGNYYPSCSGKCKPILNHMLSKMKVDLNPMLSNTGENKHIEIIHEESEFLIINKPEGLLSVPGKNIKDSVYTRLKEIYPSSAQNLIIHRLDQETSGLMIIAKTKNAHKRIQKQFIKRYVKKSYIAILSGVVEQKIGTIDLPLRTDLENRPNQIVCVEFGKSSITNYEVLETCKSTNRTRIKFIPLTGRTHQLRVHSAHFKGLNCPIVGDTLYGVKSERLHLHANWLQFKNPTSDKIVSFEINSSF